MAYFCIHFWILKKYCFETVCILMTEFSGASSLMPVVCLTQLTLVLGPPSCEDRAGTVMSISEMRQLRFSEVKPPATVAQLRVCQLTIWFGSLCARGPVALPL